MGDFILKACDRYWYYTHTQESSHTSFPPPLSLSPHPTLPSLYSVLLKSSNSSFANNSLGIYVWMQRNLLPHVAKKRKKNPNSKIRKVIKLYLSFPQTKYDFQERFAPWCLLSNANICRLGVLQRGKGQLPEGRGRQTQPAGLHKPKHQNSWPITHGAF